MQKVYELDKQYYLARYEVHEYWTNFWVWESSGLSEEGLLFGDEFQPDHTKEKPFINGSVKWDGCANIGFPQLEDCALHTCDRKGLTDIGVLLGRVWDECAALCEKSADYVDAEAQEVVEDGPFPWEKQT